MTLFQNFHVHHQKDTIDTLFGYEKKLGTLYIFNE